MGRFVLPTRRGIEAEKRESPAAEKPAPVLDIKWIRDNKDAFVKGLTDRGFDDPHDALARDILSSVYPGRRVVTVDARQIFARGGGIHCITQHQPRGRI